MIRYDIEDMMDDIESLLKEKLNTKIQEINLAKATKEPAIEIAEIDETCYHQQSWSDKLLQKTPAIFYGLENITATGANAATLEVYRIFVEVVIVDNGMDPYTLRRIHRYSRALKEVFQENYDKMPWSNKTNIETVRPVSFLLDENTSEEIKVGGVSIVTAIV